MTAGAGRYLAPIVGPKLAGLRDSWRGSPVTTPEPVQVTSTATQAEEASVAQAGSRTTAESEAWVRRDSKPYSSEGKEVGRVKAHVDADGNLRPADPNGGATVQQHVRGSEPMKSRSPYSSAADRPVEGAERFGDHEVRIDVGRLREDIAAGKVRDIELLDHQQVLDELAPPLEKAQQRYNANPTENNAKALRVAQRDMDNAVRAREVLIRGVVPSEYITVIPPTPP